MMQWHLSRTGTFPKLGNFKCTSEKNLFPLQGEQEHESSKPNRFGVYLSHLLGSFPFLQQSNKDQNLT